MLFFEQDLRENSVDIRIVFSVFVFVGFLLGFCWVFVGGGGGGGLITHAV